MTLKKEDNNWKKMQKIPVYGLITRGICVNKDGDTSSETN